ncbi:MAG: hypothetical protein ACRDF0_12340, partial [Candidatus Limnocylindria bacterium]
KDKAVVWAVDVAKVEQYGVLMDSERQVVVTVSRGMQKSPLMGIENSPPSFRRQEGRRWQLQRVMRW